MISIEANAFNGCTNLIEINLPKTLETIKQSAFYNCGYYNTTSNWNAEVLYIDSYLIKAKTEIAGAYVIKEGTSLIADDAFSLCENITSITCPNSVLYIGNRAFYYCKALTSIEMSDKILTIGSYAFENCKISSISLPKTLRSYYAGSNIKTINYAGTVAEWNSISKNSGDSFIGVTVNCSNGTV